MDLMYVDIGCSNQKHYLIRGGEVAEKEIVETTEGNIYEIIAQVNKFQNKVVAEGYYINNAIVTSLSDGVVYELNNGDLFTLWYNDKLPHYGGVTCNTISGKPPQDELHGIGNQLKHIQHKHSLDKVKRILPISTFIAAYLAGHKEWNTWDYTHASNSGMFNMHTLNWDSCMLPFIAENCINGTLYSPRHYIKKDMIDMHMGGHDTTFLYYNTPDGYITTGTWITAGKVQEKYKWERSNLPIRWLLDASGRYHKQLCLHSSDPDKYVKLAEFLPADKYNVSGIWRDELVAELRHYLSSRVRLEHCNLSPTRSVYNYLRSKTCK